MKLIIMTLLLAGFGFAAEVFEKDTQYTCLNTHNVQDGQEVPVDAKEASERPFIFMIKEDKLLTLDKTVFNFKMKKGLMSAYSNSKYMLLLTPNMVLGLVPMKARGSAQFYFSCKK